MTVVGFLHTGAVHVVTFHRLFTELAPPGLEDRHLVDESLLAGARLTGMTPALAGRLRGRLAELVAAGADLIVCTCSTIGAEAEAMALGTPVLRLDRPMAEAAVAMGERIAVVATVESTMEPSMRLLREAADQAGRPVTLLPSPCLAAWRHFEAGDLGAYDEEIAGHVRAVAAEADVVVLAQASMAGAAALLPGLPVLTSPRTAVEQAVRKAGGIRGRTPRRAPRR